MQTEKDLDRKIRGLQKDKDKKQARSASTKVTKRISFSGNPNGASDSEEGNDANMNKRMAHTAMANLSQRKGVGQRRADEQKRMTPRRTRKSAITKTKMGTKQDT